MLAALGINVLHLNCCLGLQSARHSTSYKHNSLRLCPGIESLHLLIGSSKKQKTMSGHKQQTNELADEKFKGLEALLDLVQQRGIYHPTEDSEGVHLALLSRIADTVLDAAECTALLLLKQHLNIKLLHLCLLVLSDLPCEDLHSFRGHHDA